MTANACSQQVDGSGQARCAHAAVVQCCCWQVPCDTLVHYRAHCGVLGSSAPHSECCCTSLGACVWLYVCFFVVCRRLLVVALGSMCIYVVCMCVCVCVTVWLITASRAQSCCFTACFHHWLCGRCCTVACGLHPSQQAGSASVSVLLRKAWCQNSAWRCRPWMCLQSCVSRRAASNKRWLSVLQSCVLVDLGRSEEAQLCCELLPHRQGQEACEGRTWGAAAAVVVLPMCALTAHVSAVTAVC